MKTRIFAMLVFSIIFSSSAHAALIGLPVPSAYDMTGTLEVFDASGIPLGPVPVNFDPPSGDFTFTYLGNPGVGYDSSIYTSPGTYTFMSTPDAVFPTSVELSMTVQENQIGMRTFVDWNNNIYDVLAVWDVSTSGNVTTLYATDMDGDGIRGYQMVSGPFAGLNVVMDATIVTPVPAAVWLFGSGLLGLAGFLRRKQD